MQNNRSWFIDFLAEMVEKYADVKNQGFDSDDVDGKEENGGAEL